MSLSIFYRLCSEVCLRWLVLAICVAGWLGCTRVVDLKLKQVPAQLVVEGVVANGQAGSYVKLSRSVAFARMDSFPLIAGATVVIGDSNRHIYDTLRPGRNLAGDAAYISRQIRGIQGHVYTLDVLLDGRLYTSRCQMPDSVTFRGIGLLAEAGEMDANTEFTALPRFVDPPAKGNCYQFFQYINGVKDNGFNVLNDNIGNGLPNEEPIFTKDLEIHLGDTLAIVMLNIDPVIYRIFYQLSQNAADFGVTPGNPVTNVSGGALGYFSAQYEQLLVARIGHDD